MSGSRSLSRDSQISLSPAITSSSSDIPKPVDPLSFHHVLRLPQDLLLVGHTWNTSSRSYLGGILVTSIGSFMAVLLTTSLRVTDTLRDSSFPPLESAALLSHSAQLLLQPHRPVQDLHLCLGCANTSVNLLYHSLPTCEEESTEILRNAYNVDKHRKAKQRDRKCLSVEKVEKVRNRQKCWVGSFKPSLYPWEHQCIQCIQVKRSQ